MINKTTQSWNVGDTVKVGFISNLTVTKIIPTPGDYAPDAYELRRTGKDGKVAIYEFVPHNGLCRIN